MCASAAPVSKAPRNRCVRTGIRWNRSRCYCKSLKITKYSYSLTLNPVRKRHLTMSLRPASTNFIDKCTPLLRQDYSEFAIPCLPNFTIIPKDKSGVIIDSRMMRTESGVELSREKEDILKLWIEGVYVGAAYVGCWLDRRLPVPRIFERAFQASAA